MWQKIVAHLSPIAYRLLIVSICCTIGSCKTEHSIPGPENILFLGNSITYGGRYVDYIETAFILQAQNHEVGIIDLGLSSETVSGLSETDHPFPRPSLEDRLTACLDSIQPDQVVACYGMNCGIYHPFDGSRFSAFQEGIQLLVDQTQSRGIKLTLLTPPPFAARLRDSFPEPNSLGYSYRFPYVQYDAVLGSYADWMLGFAANNDIEVVDIRTPLEEHMDLAYSSKDIIHPNSLGHALIAESLLETWNRSVFPQVLTFGNDLTAEDSTWQAVEEIVRKQRESYDRALLNHIGHQHPGILKQAVLPLGDAFQEYQNWEGKLETLMEQIY
ncbi:MAG: SGNH/GDSL hydrolase family protein [Bacteroidota bacterium]